MRLKAISPFIASVLLIGFTISTGIIVYYFLTTLPKVQTTEVSSLGQQVISCAGGFFDVNTLPVGIYRKAITIDNTLNSDNLNDYQVLVNLDTASLISQGKMRSDCGDIRFIDSDGLTQLNYWIENCTAGKIWVKVPSIPASSTKTIYVYYGNPSATSLSNGDATFLFFDDFDGTSLDTTKWVTTGGYGGDAGYYLGIYYSVSNSILTVWSDNSWRVLRMNRNFTPSDTIAVEVKFLKTADSSWCTNYLVQHDDLDGHMLGLTDWIYEGPNMGIQLIAPETFSFPKDFGPFSSNVWYISRIIKKNSTTLYLDALTSDRTFIDSYETTQSAWSTLTWTWVNWQFENIQVKYDWIFVHKYSSPEPTTSVGNEENITITFNLISSGAPSASMGNQFTSIIYLTNGTMIQKDFSLDNNCNLGKDCPLGKSTISLNSNVAIDKIRVCSKACSLICNEIKVS